MTNVGSCSSQIQILPDSAFLGSGPADQEMLSFHNYSIPHQDRDKVLTRFPKAISLTTFSLVLKRDRRGL